VDWPTVREGCRIFEDDDVLVIDKPVGVSVVGERGGTDLMQEARAAGEWLMPAHRIDKVTSGALLLAKNLETHAELTRQFRGRTVDKSYLAIVRSADVPERGTIDLPLSVGRKSRVRIAAERAAIRFDPGALRWDVPDDAVLSSTTAYPATTTFTRIWSGSGMSLLLVHPLTGRRHQIRVHLAWIGFPIEGDPLFDRAIPADRRTSLHSWRLAFDHHGRKQIEAPPGEDFWTPIGAPLERHGRRLGSDEGAARHVTAGVRAPTARSASARPSVGAGEPPADVVAQPAQVAVRRRGDQHALPRAR
jgi:tRNA pseudouridine32 synthase/23S rRNA pseudouridine746 synthase